MIDRSMFKGFLQRVIDHPVAFCHRSYQHPANGFYKIELGEVLGGKLRLHIWPGGWRGPGHIHDHRWDFISHILLGDLIERRFYEKPAERVAIEGLRHAHPYDVESLQLVRGGISLLHEHHRHAGETYTCAAGDIHQLFPRDAGRAATLVLTGPPLPNVEARVFDACERSIPGSFESRSLDPDQLHDLVSGLLVDLAG